MFKALTNRIPVSVFNIFEKLCMLSSIEGGCKMTSLVERGRRKKRYDIIKQINFSRKTVKNIFVHF